jgi:hypothetical protein
MAKTKSGKKASEYFEDVLDTASKGGEAAIAAGYPELSKYTEAYLRGIPELSQYGDEQQRQALARMGDMYGAYRRAGDYDMTNFRDLERAYGRAGEYDPTNYSDVERMYRRAGEYGPEEFSGIQRELDQAGQYDPTEFDRADYTTKNLQERMSPYEELVAKRATDRLQRQFDEAKASRDVEAARAGAFGGSGAAVAQELARRNMQEQMADVNAQSLQAAYESAVQLYGKEYADNMAAQQAEEQSRQYGSQTGLQALQQKFAAQQAGEASRQFGTQAEMQGIEGLMAARNAEEASRQFGSQMGMQGVAGQLAARQQQAGQVAAAKEAELASLQGRSQSAREQALLAEQRKNMQLANLAALQQGGQYQQDYNLARRMYPLDVAQRQAQVLGTGISGIPMQKPSQPSPYQSILGGVGAAAGLLQGVGGLKAGGIVYRGGGLAELEPEYYDQYER